MIEKTSNQVRSAAYAVGEIHLSLFADHNESFDLAAGAEFKMEDASAFSSRDECQPAKDFACNALFDRYHFAFSEEQLNVDEKHKSAISSRLNRIGC